MSLAEHYYVAGMSLTVLHVDKMSLSEQYYVARTPHTGLHVDKMSHCTTCLKNNVFPKCLLLNNIMLLVCSIVVYMLTKCHLLNNML